MLVCILLVFGLLVSFTRLSWSCELVAGYGESLYESPRVNLTYDGASLNLYVRLCNYTVTTEDGYYMRMTRYVYCTDEFNDSSCSFPGPTLLMHDNTSIDVTLINQLTGSTTIYGPGDVPMNHFKDPDTTNLHVHGLHVSPRVDDVLLEIPPNDNSQSYPYVIDYHYPGTFWYHAHHHGSTTYQVNMGLHGALLMTNDDPNEVELRETYKENVLMFNWIYAIPGSICNNNKRGGTEGSGNCTGGADNPSNSEFYQRRYDVSSYVIIDIGVADNYVMCDVYCSFPQSQLAASGYVYDVDTDIPYNFSVNPGAGGYKKVDSSLLLFFTNGQISPVIDDVIVGEYRRLRMVNSLSNWYLQFQFPEECEWHLIATDGVYIGGTYMNYDLSQSSHDNNLIISPGGRADVMFRCLSNGTYDIYSSEMDLDPELSTGAFQRVYGIDGEYDLEYKLFTIEVSDGTPPTGSDELPSTYPDKEGYIANLANLDEDDVEKDCSCSIDDVNTPITSKQANGTTREISNDECYFEFSIKNCNFNNPTDDGGMCVNSKPFSISTMEYPHYADALKIIQMNKAYEFFILNSDTGRPAHVYHQHINPFQVQEKVGENGFFALPLTWWDTLGNNGTVIRARMWTLDYYGLVIVHCHLLQHEDQGMMGFYVILNDSVSGDYCPYDTDEPTEGPTDYPIMMTSSTEMSTTEETVYMNTTEMSGPDKAYSINTLFVFIFISYVFMFIL